MKRLIINILAAVCCAAYSMPNVSAQDYIDYSDYISYEDIETLDIQPIVNYNNNFNYYQFADYKYITSDKSIIMDFLNELFPLAVTEEESEQLIKYSVSFYDNAVSNMFLVDTYSAISSLKNHTFNFTQLYIADAEIYEEICEKYIPLMEIEQIEKKASDIGHGYHPSDSFRILACSDWAIDYIADAYFKGIITYGDIFTDTIDRKYFCDILYNIFNHLGYTSGINGISGFEDADSESVNVLAAMGIIEGRDEKTFAPDDNITREEIAVIINRVMEYGGIRQERADVIYEDDDSISEWAKDSVYNIAGSDIMYGDGVYFKPQDNCSKEQAIAALMRLYYCFE